MYSVVRDNRFISLSFMIQDYCSHLVRAIEFSSFIDYTSK